MKNEQKRWLILLAGFLSNLCQGIAYASSVFSKPIQEAFGIDKAQAALAFSLIIACLPIGTICGGILNGKKGAKMPIVIGSVIFSLGLFLAAFTVNGQNLFALYITYGVMLGIGSGMAYGSIVGTVTQWFPDKKGLAGGLVVAALGGGPVVLAPIMSLLITSQGLTNSFLILGIVFAVIMIGAALLVVNPPKEYVPEGLAKAESKGGKSVSGNDYAWNEMLKSIDFWFMAFMFFAGTFAGLMIISKAAGLCKDVLGDSGSAALAVLGVQIIAACNALGRLFWGAVSDRCGRMTTLLIMFALSAVLMAVLNFMSFNFVVFLIGLAVCGLCFGGYLGMFPALCADYFGVKNITLNFGILFTAFAISGVFAPMVGAKCSTVMGYYISAVIAILGLVFTAVLKNKKR